MTRSMEWPGPAMEPSPRRTSPTAPRPERTPPMRSSSHGRRGQFRPATVAGGGTPTGWTNIFEGPIGDARGSSANALSGEFLGDYNYAAATRDYGIGIYIDVRDAADCPAVDAWRQSLADGTPTPKPAPNSDCP